MDPSEGSWRETEAGRTPRISAVRRRIILRLAKENLGWGYRRMVGELFKLHLPVGRSSIRRILQEEGLMPPPNSGRRSLAIETPWRKFLRLHMNTLVACDFFTKNVITPFGTRTAYGLFFIHLQARNVQMWLEEESIEARFLIRDRDTKFATAVDALFAGVGIRIVKTPVQAPNANAFAESWIGSLKRECLDRFVCFSRGHLDHILHEHVRFYNRHRPHQGLGNRTLAVALGSDPPPLDRPESDPIRWKGSSVDCCAITIALLDD